VSVQIPANSIVDSHGNPATGPLKLSISSVDLLSPQQMPGDDSVVPKSGGGGYIESFGAGSLDMPAGFKLKPGATAKVTIPVDRSQLAGTLAPTVPLLSYDETKGLWMEEGTLSLTTVGGVKSYVGDVKHFSAFNADSVKTTDSACLRVFSPSLPTHYNLEVSAPYHGTGAPKVLTKQVDQDASGENVIYNLPSNVNITLAPMTLAPNPQLLGFYIVNSGQPQNPNTSPLAPPGPPYLSCNNFVVLKVGSAPESPFGGEFLHGLGYLAAENLGFDDLTNAAPTGNTLKDAIVAASKNYYSHLDPNSNRTTFTDFKTNNGFSLDPTTPAAGEIVGQYANSGDLGFGRDMHCLKKANGNVACYVTNYGTGYNNNAPGDGTSDTDDAQAAETRTAVNQSHEVATVAMEYAPIDNDPAGDKVVKFYVYKKNFPNAGDYGRSISANLDGRGERPVPQLCMICHGGQAPSESGVPPVPAFGSANQVKLNARFLPFDYRFYTFADTTTPARTAAQWKSTQDSSFQNLNQQIVNAAPPTGANDPIHELITGLYSNGNAPPQAPNFVVPGWANGASANASGQAAFYTGIIANGCRTCHVAQSFAQLQFNTSDKFVNVSAASSPVPVPANNKLMLGTAQSRVCGDYTMPHALRTHDIFWNVYWDVPNWGAPPSPPFPTQFQNFGNGVGGSTWQAGLCTSFISSTVASPSHFYEQSIQPIWNGKCVACHVSGGVASFLDLTEGNSFTTVSGLITPGNDSAGTLIQKVTSTSTASPLDRMPPGCFRAPEPPNGALPCLSQADVDKIKAWIRSGAN
jgi:mono/diheme cytochrome c family protein